MLLTTIYMLNAKDFGVFGETFPITEKNLLHIIQSKLQVMAETGKIKEHQQHILSQTKNRLKRPPTVEGIQKTHQPRAFLYDPSLIIPYDLKDHEGKIFYSKGSQINPLDTQRLRIPLLFIDGDDEQQVSWAVQHFKKAKADCKPKIILVKGHPFDLMEKVSFPIYFDQGGQLVKKMSIKQVPACVQQQGKKLLIKEMTLD